MKTSVIKFSMYIVMLFAFPLASVYAAGAIKEGNPSNWGQRKDITWDDLKAGFAEPDKMYAPFMFWFWDEPLNANKMAEMSDVMCSVGFNPGYAHARRSMVGTPGLPGEQWLGSEWFEAFGAALDVAEKQGYYLGYCDEYWWPSFQAHGRVLKKHPDLKPISLNYQVIDVNASDQVTIPSSFFTVAAQIANPNGERLSKMPSFGKWIWHPQGTYNTHNCWFRKTIQIPDDKQILNASIVITADNEFVLYANGKRVGANPTWMDVTVFDLKDYLKSGNNIITVEAKNIDSEYGLTAGLVGEYVDGDFFEYHTDKTWLTSLSKEPGCETNPFDDSAWLSAKELTDFGGGPWTSLRNPERQVDVLSKSMKVIGQGNSFNWKSPSNGPWRIYVFNQYHPAGIDGGQVNSIDNRLADAFIDIALTPYVQNMGEKMGQSIPGDFIDHEGDYGRGLAWSEALDKQYKSIFGSDIRLSIPLMIDKDAEGEYAKARWQWFEVVSDLYCGNFQAITDWHEKRGMYTTAHVWEESLNAQVTAVGDHMKLLRSLTMPCQDCLGRKALRVHDFKEPYSVAEFENARAATELMGAGGFEGTPWGTFTPPFLKQASNSITAWGMSHVIPHGVFTTRKLTGNPWPPDWYNENPMYPYLNHWAKFTCRASYINSMGHAVPDVLLYNPLESAWVNTDTDFLGVNMWALPEDHPGGQRISEIDAKYTEAINSLTDARIEFLIGDRYYLDQMTVKKASLVRGHFSFSTIVLPPLDILTLSSAQKIVDFAHAGGMVISLGSLPNASAEHGMNDSAMIALMKDLVDQPSYANYPQGMDSALSQEMASLKSSVTFNNGSFPMLQHRRRIAGKDFFWLANNSMENHSCSLRINGVKGVASIWDCETGEIRPVSSRDVAKGSMLELTFKPLEAYWLVFDAVKPAQNVPDQPAMKHVMDITGDWTVSYDKSIQPPLEYPINLPDLSRGQIKPLNDWKTWAPEKFSGLLDYKKTISIDKKIPKMYLDLGKVCWAAEVWVNGKSVGTRLWEPYIYDISPALRSGKNEIHVRVANLINNSYGEVLESGLFGPVELKTKNEN